MFLVRAAFWLAVVVLLLPGDPNSGANAPRVSAIEALMAMDRFQGTGTTVVTRF